VKKALDFIPIAIGAQSVRIISLLLILLSGSIYFFRDNISLFPSFIHAWTQSDRYALALGFLNNGFDFFHPKTYNLLTVDGITRVDFPIHEYIVALLMKITGLHEPVIFRLYMLVYAIAGLVFLFRLCNLFTTTFYKNLFVVIFLFLSPVYLYYADGFLPSIPSLSNVFIGYYFYFRYKKSSVQKDFTLAIFFLTLAALARLPFFIFLFAVCCQQVLGYFKDKKISRKEVAAFGISFSVFIFYQCYNHWLGIKYGAQFLMQILPASNKHQLKEWILSTWSNWKVEYFTVPQYIILAILILLFSVDIFRKKTSGLFSNPLFVQVCIAMVGSVIYFFMMLKQFPDHDYYFIDTFYTPIILLVIFLASKSFDNKILHGISWTVILFFMYQAFGQAKEVMDKRYTTNYWDRNEITRKNFMGTEKFLDSLGISKDAKVLVLDGYTTNVPLILMNRMGWTVNWTTEYNIREGLSKPFDIVAIQNSFIASDVVRNYPGIISQLAKFADNGLVSFYRKNKSQQLRDQFFGIDSSTVLYRSSFPRLIAIDASSEYFDLLTDSFSGFPSGSPTKILVSGKLHCNSEKPKLISSMSDADSTYYYFLYDLNSFENRDSWQPLMFQFVIPARKQMTGAVKTYFWNEKNVQYELKDLEVVAYR
jgi:hypothetical protein